jgi:hypothetical protein
MDNLNIWTTFAAVGAFIIASIVAVRSVLSESISIREYVEFKQRMDRDIDRIEKQIKFIEQTRPSAGQLDDAIRNIKDRLEDMKRPRR